MKTFLVALILLLTSGASSALAQFTPGLLGYGTACSAPVTLAINSQESSNAAHHSSSSPGTSTFDNTSGTFLVIAVDVTGNASDLTVTYAGTAMSLGPSMVDGDPYPNNLYYFYLDNPATGSNTVSVSWSGSPYDVLWGGISFVGAKPGTQLTNYASANNADASTTPATVNLTGTISGDYVLTAVETGTGVTSAVSPTTTSALLNVSENTGGDNFALGQQSTTGGTVTGAFNVDADNWGILSAEVVGQSGSGCQTIPTATSYTLNGPSTGTVGSPTSDFTVASNGKLTSAVTITPSDNGHGGSFSPASCQLAIGNLTSCQFEYTPAIAGTFNIATTNSASLINPNPISFTSSSSSETSFYVCATATCSNASDSNVGSIAAPFVTLAKCQSAMESQPSTGIKTCTVRAGTYNISQALALGSADNGETWQYYPADGVNTAVLDGGDSVSGGMFAITGAAANITINGIKIENFVDYGIDVGGPDAPFPTGITVENCDIGFNTITSWNSGGITDGNSEGMIVANNYVHDIGSQGIGMYGQVDGSIVENNVVLRAVQRMSDGGAIYSIMTAQTLSKPLTIKNNWVADYGAVISGMYGQNGIYQDEGSNHIVATGNIVGPPTKGSLTGSNTGNAIFDAGPNNTYSGNIIDLGSSALMNTVTFYGYSAYGMADSVSENNVILSNFTGSLKTGGPAYPQTLGPASDYTIQNNDYWNYAAGGSIFTTGSLTNDSNPTNVNPQISGLYSIASSSPVSGPPVNFPAIVGGWGPPGFTVTQPTDYSP